MIVAGMLLAQLDLGKPLACLYLLAGFEAPKDRDL
jgi:hypothetical protein